MPAVTMAPANPNEGLVQNADGKWVKRTGVWGDIDAGQESMRGAVEGYGEILKPGLMQQIGTALGGLNSIGALRSGATVTALNDIGTSYAQQVGAYASQTAAQGASIGLEARDRITAAKRARDARRSALLGSIGSVLGAGIGFVVGGPVGAGMGSQVGQAVTGGNPVNNASYG